MCHLIQWIQVCITLANELNSPLVDLTSIWGEMGGLDVILQTTSDMEEYMMQIAVRS